MTSPKIREISAGYDFSLAIDYDGQVWGWGNDYSGQLGSSYERLPQHSVLRPTRIDLPEKARTIAAGHGASVAILEDDRILAWGLLHGTNTESPPIVHSSTPVELQGFPTLASVSTVDNRVVGLSQDGTVWHVGQTVDGKRNQTPQQVVGLSDIVEVSTGEGHELALREDGTVWGWGNSLLGQLGLENRAPNPVAIPVHIMGLSHIVSIAAGGEHCLALRNDGVIMSWGWNGAGQLGRENGDSVYSPDQVPTIANVVSIAAGTDHSIAVAKDGTIWIWGESYFNPPYQLSLEVPNEQSDLPEKKAIIPDIKTISTGLHTLILTNSGTVLGWGKNNFGQLGNGTATDTLVPSPVVWT